MAAIDFSTLISRHLFTLTLELETPLHIGTTYEDASASRMPILRNTEGFPVLPGSSIKGVMRTASEKLGHLLEEGHPICFLSGDENCTQKHKNIISNALAAGQDEKKAYHEIYHLLCPACQTYGGGNIASKITFSPVVFKEGSTAIRDSVKIKRDTGTAEDKAKFDYEMIESGIQFQVEIEAENMTPENEKVLGLALYQLMKNELRFGGLHSRGLGKIKWISGTVAEKRYDKTTLASLINGLQAEEKSVEDYLQNLYGVPTA